MNLKTNKPRPLCAEPHPKAEGVKCMRQSKHQGRHQGSIFAIKPNADGTDWCDWGHATSLSWGEAKDAYALPKEGVAPAPYFDYDAWVASLRSQVGACERLVEMAVNEPSIKFWKDRLAKLQQQLSELEISHGL